MQERFNKQSGQLITDGEKLLLVVPLPPPHHGSNVMNQYVVNCPELSKKYNIKILPLHYATDIADIGKISIKKLMALVRYLARTLILLITFRPDAVYFVPAVTGFSFYRDCLFALIFKCFRVHIIYHLHGKGIKNKLHSHFLRKLYRWFFKDASVIHLSPLLYDDIKDVVSHEQCRFLANGIDAPSLYPTNETKGEDKKPIILFISNLHTSKGPLVLLDACQILKKRGMVFKTYFVGNSSPTLTEDKFLAKIERLGLKDYVEYIGPRYGNDKYEILMKSDIFVLPTEKEAFPLVLLEAMAAGLPIVTTNEGGIPEIVHDGITGFIVDKQNPQQLADKIKYLILNPEQRQKMGQTGREMFELKYTLTSFYEHLMHIFNDVFLDQEQARE